MYYTAATTPHGGLAPEKEQFIARAAWRIDGLASLQAKDKLGSIETHDFVPEGDKLTVNADVKKRQPQRRGAGRHRAGHPRLRQGIQRHL